jgi:hypothetical protein
MEVVAGLEPAKIGFADRRLDHFGITTKDLYPARCLSSVYRAPEKNHPQK